MPGPVAGRPGLGALADLARRRALCRRGLGDAAQPLSHGAAAGRHAVLPQAAAVLLAGAAQLCALRRARIQRAGAVADWRLERGSRTLRLCLALPERGAGAMGGGHPGPDALPA
ncbi:hypothetical protein G6F57_021453 [Rhizopus arrhizus]|nr:hypothetical protein G6F57_021453 [Rhizopus arrhizus]